MANWFLPNQPLKQHKGRSTPTALTPAINRYLPDPGSASFWGKRCARVRAPPIDSGDDLYEA